MKSNEKNIVFRIKKEPGSIEIKASPRKMAKPSPAKRMSRSYDKRSDDTPTKSQSSTPVKSEMSDKRVKPSSPDRKIGQKIGMRLRNLLKLPKAHKWVCYEWFYSNIDK